MTVRSPLVLVLAIAGITQLLPSTVEAQRTPVEVNAGNFGNTGGGRGDGLLLQTPIADGIDTANVSGSTSRVGGGFFARTEHLSAPSAAFHRTRLDFGMRLRPLEHLAIDVGIGFGGGRMRRPSGQDRLTEVGLAVDLVGYLNPRSTAQLFVVGGVGFGAAGSSEQVGEVDPECPSDGMFFADVSLGAGLEVALSDTVSLIGSTRVVRRTAFAGELEFLSDSTNPPDQPLRSVIAVAAEVRVVLYFGPAPVEERSPIVW